MKRKTAAAAAALLASSVLSGAAAMPGSATAGGAVHTKRLVLHETASHQLGRNTFAGADIVRSRATHKIVGYDSFTGRYDPETDTAVLDVALALKGGVIVGRVRISGSGGHFHGPILKGTGRFQGIDGTISGREPGGARVQLTLRYQL